MSKTLKDHRAACFFDAYAPNFNAIYGNGNKFFNRIINNSFRRSMWLRYQKTLMGCQPIAGKKVIDVGCGPGHYSVALAKAGALSVMGLDFAPGMIDIAKRNAENVGVGQNCRFDFGDFLTYPFSEKFDFAVVMGFMDYVRDAEKVVRRVLKITGGRAFFSFPTDGGMLAWQRKIRYKSRCDLFMYSLRQLEGLFGGLPVDNFTIEPIERDFFVTVQICK